MATFSGNYLCVSARILRRYRLFRLFHAEKCGQTIEPFIAQGRAIPPPLRVFYGLGLRLHLGDGERKRGAFAQCRFDGQLPAVAALFLRTRRLKRTLEEREGQLVVAREKAEESDMLKSAFLANMSHEIRTPLNAIVGFSSLMQGEELSQEERAEYCAIVVNNSEMLLTLLNDILDISSLECGKIKFNCSSEEIVQVCQHVLMTTAHTRQEGVEGRLECAVGSYMLVTDVHRLSQILINLLTNAGKFTSQGSITLGVEIDEAHREVLFSVADTGPGIPLDKQEMVFNRFEKLDGNKKKGTGLGLAICRQIAMIFGGRIWVDPTYTAGARFVFAHPIDIRFPEDGENRGGVSPLEAPGSSR